MESCSSAHEARSPSFSCAAETDFSRYAMRIFPHGNGDWPRSGAQTSVTLCRTGTVCVPEVP